MAYSWQKPPQMQAFRAANVKAFINWINTMLNYCCVATGNSLLYICVKNSQVDCCLDLVILIIWLCKNPSLIMRMELSKAVS